MRNVLIILTAVLLLVVTVLVIVLARGYQFDFKNARLAPTGILVATSDPDGAEVFINGKLTTATNNTINLAPGKYFVKISKDGFAPWEKQISIRTEEVFKTSVVLFPNTPQLTPLTFTGAKNPLPSPDGTKLAYAVASASAEKNGLWVLEMSRNSFPAGVFSGAGFRLISKAIFPDLVWSPENNQLLASSSGLLLDTDRVNHDPEVVTPQKILAAWQEQRNLRLPKPPVFLASASADLQFSLDETKIFYQATVSATLPAVLVAPLPGSNPTPEIRDLKPKNYYVYDLKEDKNYLISDCLNCAWFPTSRHLVSHSDKEIAVREYDGTNKAVVYSGPFTGGFVFPWPNGSKIVILTSLNSPAGVGENLYTINLR